MLLPVPSDFRVASTKTFNKARGSRALRKDFVQWAGTALANMTHYPKPDDGWTPTAVGDQYLAALNWVRYAACRVGPAGLGGCACRRRS